MRNKNKILYVDPLSPDGHINFNSIYIKALYKYYKNIEFAFKESYDKNLQLSHDAVIYNIPKKFYSSPKNIISRRFNYYRIFKYIKNNIKLEDYDFILMSSFEEISLFLSNYKIPVVLVHHNNFRSISNPLKLHFYKKVANKNFNIVFEEYMKNCHNSLGIEKSYVVKHGLPNVIDKKIISTYDLENQYNILEQYDFILFSPSSSSVNVDFLKEVISNKSFLDFLHENKILLLIKGNFVNINQSVNVKIINRYLTDDEYNYLFLKSSAILISYSDAHKYRVSAILFECMSNNKLCIISKIEALYAYKNNFIYNPYFSNISDLQDRISSIIDLPDSIKEIPFKNKNNLQPSFDEVVKLFSNKLTSNI